MSFEYEIEIETPVYVDPNLIARKTREVIKRLIEQHGVFSIEVIVRVATDTKKEGTEGAK